jgi:hypothetical protein
LIGIHAGEAHRAKDDPLKRYPLVEKDYDQDDCISIIKAAGLCTPYKSGCWCCPFMRKGEIIALAKEHPERFSEIVALESAAQERHPDGVRMQWAMPARKYLALAAQGDFHEELDENDSLPCECFQA